MATDSILCLSERVSYHCLLILYSIPMHKRVVAGSVHVSVRDLEAAHALLCDSSGNVSQRYGPVLLVDMLNLLLHSVISAYFFFSMLVIRPKLVPNSAPYVVLQFFWLLAHLGRMLLLVTYCSKAKSEVRHAKTGGGQ